VIPVVKKNHAPVPKTGQTGCYKSADPWGTCTCDDTDCPSGQDGDLERGVSWPNPRFTDNGDGTVTDNLTGLVWMKNANCDGGKNWADALTYCNGLHDGCTNCGGAENDCGLSDSSQAGDWRMPNVRELPSLIHYGFTGPALPDTAGTGQWSAEDPFTNVQSSGRYWSSTTRLTDYANAFATNFENGEVNARGKSHTYTFAWCVRGGQ